MPGFSTSCYPLPCPQPLELALDSRCPGVRAGASPTSSGFVLDLPLLCGCDQIQPLNFVRSRVSPARPRPAYDRDHLRPPSEQEGTDLPRRHSRSPEVLFVSPKAPTSAVCTEVKPSLRTDPHVAFLIRVIAQPRACLGPYRLLPTPLKDIFNTNSVTANHPALDRTTPLSLEANSALFEQE